MLVEPREPDEVITKEDEVVCIWKECPNVFGRRSEWRVTVKEDGRSFAQGEGGSEHYPLGIVAIKIAKGKGILKRTSPSTTQLGRREKSGGEK